jgi:hypothetical protein
LACWSALRLNSLGYVLGPYNALMLPKTPLTNVVSKHLKMRACKFDVRYYLVAILFILFDLEIAFSFPWAVVAQGNWFHWVYRHDDFLGHSW